MKEVVAWLGAIAFVIMGCFPDQLPFVDEIVSFLLSTLSEKRIAAIVAILVLAALSIFGICKPLVGLV